MSKKKHHKPTVRPVTREEAMAIFARFERGDISSDREEVGLIKRLVSGKDAVVPVLLERLRNGSAIEQGLASHVLPQIGGDAAKESLWEMAHDPNIPTRAKAIILGTLDEMGEAIEDEIAPSLYDPAKTGPEIIDEIFAAAADDETVLEATVHEIEEMPAEKRTELIRMMGACGSEKGLRLLLPLVHVREKATTMSAIDGLESLGMPQAVPTLTTLSQVSPHPEIRDRARSVYSRLALKVTSQPAPASDQAIQPLPLFKALVSTIDGDGAQEIVVGRRRPDARLKLICILFNDHQGIKECFGQDQLPLREWNRILSDFDYVSWVPLNLHQCRFLLDEALLINKKNHRRLPVELEIWGALLQDGPEAPGASKDEAAINISNDLILEPKLLRRTSELTKLKEFGNWFFDPRQIEISDVIALDTIRESRMKEAEKAARFALVVSSITGRLAKPNTLVLLEKRLRRQAWLLQELGRNDHSRLALAAASAMNKQSGISPEEQPFLQEMTVRAVQLMSRAMEETVSEMDIEDEDEDDD